LRAVHDKIKLRDAYARLTSEKSVLRARSQSENDKTRNDGNDNDHPVLAVEAQ
jgi:hypothetical protein